MPYWYYDKKDLRNTPSFRDGIDFEVERRYRKEGARFIMQIGTTMGLGHNTIATGIVYYHRFYMLHSFKTFPRYVTASCCLFLAGKVEETPKKCKDIIKIAKSFLSEQKFLSFGEDPKEEVMTLERILLQTIKFDLQVDHPYNFLVKYAKCLKGDQSKLQKIVQMAWNFVNDSLSTTLCLQWEPEIIAVALIYLACKLSKFNVVDWQGRAKDHLKWWDMFVKDITMDVLEDICHQVLDLYQKLDSHEGDESPPQQPPSRAASPPSKKVKMTMQANQPTGVPVIVPPPGPPSGPNTPLKPVQPPGNNIPVKVLSNDGSVDVQQPHKIGKIMNNNVHYAAPYPSTSGYGYASTSSLPQQPPPPPIPPPVHSNPHHQPPPPPYTNNLHSHNSAGYSSRSGPPQPGPQIPSYNAPPPPSTAYHPPLHHGAPPPGPPLPMSHHYQPVNANYYPNSQHHHRNHRNSNYHYPPH